MTNLIPINFNNEIVITTKTLAEVYECKEQQITQNFNNNEDKFEEGKHYFKLTGEALKKLRIENIDLQISPMTRTFYLWTKRGASRHCKMLGTDKAWDMFDSLEENYFNPKVPQLTDEDQAVLDIVNAADKAETALAVKNYKDIVTKPLNDTIEKQSEVIEEMKPKALVGEALEVSKDSCLVGELAKLLKQNGVDIGQNRLFEWMRENGYLIRRKGADYNMPTQKSMNLGLFEIKETNIVHSDGTVKTRKTPKVTGKGKVYFINKFLSPKELMNENKELVSQFKEKYSK